MQINPNRPLFGMPTKATITLYSGDHLLVEYTDPNGARNSITIDVQHLVMIAAHEQSQSALIIRPSTGCTYSQPI